LATLLFFHPGPPPAPAPLDGDWAGAAGGSGGAFTMSVTVIAGGSAIVHYAAPYNCDGTWHLLSQEGNVYTYRETIVYQYSLGPATKCSDQDTVVMTLDPARNTVQYSASPRGANGTSASSGVLENVTAPDPPGWTPHP
jgi:hypothetical protein